MKIIKVIVDELPESCFHCRGAYDDPVNGYMCNVMIKVLYPKDDFDKRPDWCPLVTQEQVLRDFASPFANWEESEEE